MRKIGGSNAPMMAMTNTCIAHDCRLARNVSGIISSSSLEAARYRACASRLEAARYRACASRLEAARYRACASRLEATRYRACASRRARPSVRHPLQLSSAEEGSFYGQPSLCAKPTAPIAISHLRNPGRCRNDSILPQEIENRAVKGVGAFPICRMSSLWDDQRLHAFHTRREVAQEW